MSIIKNGQSIFAKKCYCLNNAGHIIKKFICNFECLPLHYLVHLITYTTHWLCCYSYQQAGYPTPPNTPVTPPPGNAEAQQNPQDVNQQEFDDADADELEFRQQDWLDYIYTFSRCMVLIGIVYFYSSLSRFLMVGGCFLFVYLWVLTQSFCSVIIQNL